MDTNLDFGVVCPAVGLRRLFDRRSDLFLCLLSSSSLFTSRWLELSDGVLTQIWPFLLLADDGDAVSGVLATIPN